MRITCDRCGKDRMLNEAHTAHRDMRIRAIIAKMRHDGCGGRPGSRSPQRALLDRRAWASHARAGPASWVFLEVYLGASPVTSPVGRPPLQRVVPWPKHLAEGPMLHPGWRTSSIFSTSWSTPLKRATLSGQKAKHTPRAGASWR
jgi:hypothetical protein